MKDKIRNEILEIRKKMSLTDVEKLSNEITEKFMSEFSTFGTYLLYYSFDNEVKTDKLISLLQKKGKSVYLPVLNGNDRLGVGEFFSKDNLIRNRFGIFEPSKPVDKDTFDIAVIPGVAFDKKCNRLGFGKGYYDRFLKNIETKLNIGLSYDLQIVDELPSEAHDEPMDIVLTETKIYRRN